MQRRQRQAKAGWTRGKLLPGSFIAVSSWGMSTARARARCGFHSAQVRAWASILFSNNFQPTLAEQSCVYSTTFRPCVIYNCSFAHIFTWLSSVRIAVEITIYTSVTEMLPSLTRLEPRYDVTHTDSDGNTMKNLPGSVLPRLQPR